MKRYFNYLRNQKAQIVLPAILLVPTILLVIYLLFETAKLSRFKIRSQFALDSAAFIELTSYSNFLNAVSYVNGAFPFRVFRENMGKTVPKEEDCEENESGCGMEDEISYYDLFYQAGAFPAMAKKESNPRDNAGRWELQYNVANPAQEQDLLEGKGRPSNWNSDNPKVEDSLAYGINKKQLVEQYKYIVISKDEDENNNGNNKDDDGPIAPLTLYIAVYKMFENIYENQKKVYERLTADGEFFRKSYYYNSSSCKLSQCGKDGARILKNYKLGFESVYLNKFTWYWRSRTSTSANSVEFTKEKPDYEKFMPLYQFSYLDKTSKGKLKKMYTGIDIREPIVPPDNYFRVNLKKYAKKLHVRAALQCTNESNNCVWPNPTPKYQVRLYP